MKKLFCLFVIVLTIQFNHLHAQSYYFRHLQVENGLSHNTVYCSIQDKKGFLWFGTKDGLNRYDGYTFKVFSRNPKDKGSLGNNIVLALYEDINNNIWVGTDNGLYIYNSESESFKSFKPNGTAKVNVIKGDKQGNIWFISNGVLKCYDVANKKIMIFESPKNSYITSLCFTSEGKLWLSTSRGTLEEYHSKDHFFSSYNLFTHSKWIATHEIETIYCVNNSSILVGSSVQGFKIFDISNKKYSDVLNYNKNGTAVYVRNFLKSSENEYWIATESGIFIYNAIKKSFINLRKKNNDFYSLSDNAVYCLTKDKEGGIWAGTYFEGISYYPKQYSPFTKFYPGNDRDLLKGNVVREIAKDRYNNLWIGTEDNGLNKLNTLTNKWTHYLPGSKESISNTNIHGIFPNGNDLFIGSFKNGLDVMNIQSGKVIRHYIPSNKAHSLNSNFILTIIKTKSGKILLGSAEGLYTYNQITKDFTLLDLIPHNDFIHTIYEDHSNKIWVGTWNDGIYCLDLKHNKSEKISSVTKGLNALNATMVTSIYEDSNLNFWFCTDGLGLWKYNPLNKSKQVYDINNQLPSNYTYRILEDNSKNIWISTARGLVCMNLNTGHIKIYTKSNGLLSDQFNYNSAFKDVDGTMYFGCVKGMISFKPALFLNNNYKPAVYITGFQIQNKEIGIHGKETPIAKSITYTKNINLKYNQSSISFDFAALSYSSPEMTQYRYKLEGLDTGWTYLRTNRKVYFTGLLPGNYSFDVQASNNTLWNTAITSLKLVISPPYWLSIWAYMLYLSLFILVIAYLVHRYHKQVQEKNKRIMEVLENEKEKEIYHAKIEFFTNIAHEIKTPLTLIKGPMEKIIKKAHEIPEIEKNLLIMEKNTNRLLNLTNQLLDFRKTEKSGFSLSFVEADIKTLVEDIYQRFKSVAENQNLIYTLEVPEETFYAYVDIEALTKILSNIISNALKYCSERVQVELRIHSIEYSIFCIEVKNDGYIIPYEMREKIFEPFFRLKGTEKQPGTGIGLSLARSLAELHNGILQLQMPLDKLNIFNLTLPIHQEKEFSFIQDK